MRSIFLRRSILPLLVLAAVACSDGSTAPSDLGEDFEPVELALDRIDRGETAPAVEDRQVPTLQRLLHEAVDRVRAERGAEAARRLIAPLRTILEAARDARQTGDIATARRLMREANLTAARIVIRVFGANVVTRVDAHLGTGIAALESKLAAGETDNPEQLQRVIERATERRTAIARLIERGAYPAALVLAAETLDRVRAASVLL